MYGSSKDFWVKGKKTYEGWIPYSIYLIGKIMAFVRNRNSEHVAQAWWKTDDVCWKQVEFWNFCRSKQRPNKIIDFTLHVQSYFWVTSKEEVIRKELYVSTLFIKYFLYSYQNLKKYHERIELACRFQLLYVILH